jgi:hypothetical protein
MVVTNELGYSLKSTVEHQGEVATKYIAEIPAPMPMDAWTATYGGGDDPNTTVQ